MLDTAPLQNAYHALLDAATAAHAEDPSPTPPDGEWNADQVLAHVSLVSAATIAAVTGITAGARRRTTTGPPSTPGPSSKPSRTPVATPR
ncbi:hypothetical protein [Streptomyces sp. SCL15-6]|uniref:hypothetical protein n=1 Tax=Streptomyces sp. SCL15-6 TaxID=2967222 RepID=UPI002966161C|nr:hypothetical protein [Streptomyces sp. SCL15-6]